jgi:hypothetical protein
VIITPVCVLASCRCDSRAPRNSQHSEAAFRAPVPHCPIGPRGLDLPPRALISFRQIILSDTTYCYEVSHHTGRARLTASAMTAGARRRKLEICTRLLDSGVKSSQYRPGVQRIKSLGSSSAFRTSSLAKSGSISHELHQSHRGLLSQRCDRVHGSPSSAV